jgi:NRPS condensation-like uncharacterized protein
MFPLYCVLKGKLNKPALSGSIQEIINRHEVLRTVIRQREGQPYQYVMEKGKWNMNIVPGTQYENDDDGLQDYIDGLIAEPFDLSKDHMLRAWLIVMNEEESVLVVVLHHIASDGWSRSILVKELVELYEQLSENNPIQLPLLPLQYADYAIWQRGYFSREVLAAKLSYWKNQLSGITPLALPTDFTRPAVQTVEGAAYHYTIDKALANKIQQLGQQHGTTLYMTDVVNV